jgi:predicted CoA-binding protein
VNKDKLQPQDQVLQNILSRAKTIAVVGHSHNPDRPSYQVAQFLRQHGYRIYPVNPTLTHIDGDRCYSSLKDLPETVDIANIFRRSDYLPELVTEIIQTGIARTIWAQTGVTHPEAWERATRAGLLLIMDTCIQVEYQRLAIGP